MKGKCFICFALLIGTTSVNAMDDSGAKELERLIDAYNREIKKLVYERDSHQRALDAYYAKKREKTNYTSEQYDNGNNHAQ